MPTPRSGVAAAAVDGRIFVAGGRDEQGQPVDVLEHFDPKTGEWTTLSPMPTARSEAAAVAYRGRLLVIGGRAPEDKEHGRPKQRVVGVVEAYDPVSNSWSELGQLNQRREGHVAFVLNDTVFVAGGSDHGANILRSIETLDPTDPSRWQVSEHLALDMPAAAPAVAVARGSAFIFGGFSPGPINAVQAFRGTRSRENLPPGQFRARGSHAAAALGDTVYVLGGRGPKGKGQGRGQSRVLADVDAYALETDEWQEAEPLPEPRQGFAAVAVGTGGAGCARGGQEIDDLGEDVSRIDEEVERVGTDVDEELEEMDVADEDVEEETEE